jgi:hypothetical protein
MEKKCTPTPSHREKQRRKRVARARAARRRELGELIKRRETQEGVCYILAKHQHDLQNDPERLTTDFIKKTINRDADPCPGVDD